MEPSSDDGDDSSSSKSEKPYAFLPQHSTLTNLLDSYCNWESASSLDVENDRQPSRTIRGFVADFFGTDPIPSPLVHQGSQSSSSLVFVLDTCSGSTSESDSRTSFDDQRLSESEKYEVEMEGPTGQVGTGPWNSEEDANFQIGESGNFSQTYVELLQKYCFDHFAQVRYRILPPDPPSSRGYLLGLRRSLKKTSEPDSGEIHSDVIFEFQPNGRFRVRSDLDFVIRTLDCKKRDDFHLDSVKITALRRFVTAALPESAELPFSDFLQGEEPTEAKKLAVCISCFLVGCYCCFLTDRLMYGRSYREYVNRSLEELNQAEENDTVTRFLPMIRVMTTHMKARPRGGSRPWLSRFSLIQQLRVVLDGLQITTQIPFVSDLLSGKWFGRVVAKRRDSKLIPGYVDPDHLPYVASPLAVALPGEEKFHMLPGEGERVRLIPMLMTHVTFEEMEEDVPPAYADSFVDSRTTAVFWRDLRPDDFGEDQQFLPTFRQMEMLTSTSSPKTEYEDRSHVPIPLSLQIEVEIATGKPTVSAVTPSDIGLRHLCQIERRAFRTKMMKYLSMQRVRSETSAV